MRSPSPWSYWNKRVLWFFMQLLVFKRTAYLPPCELSVWEVMEQSQNPDEPVFTKGYHAAIRTLELVTVTSTMEVKGYSCFFTWKKPSHQRFQVTGFFLDCMRANDHFHVKSNHKKLHPVCSSECFKEDLYGLWGLPFPFLLWRWKKSMTFMYIVFYDWGTIF